MVYQERRKTNTLRKFLGENDHNALVTAQKRVERRGIKLLSKVVGHQIARVVYFVKLYVP
jgi:predicted site-specific integrase-resolvase